MGGWMVFTSVGSCILVVARIAPALCKFIWFYYFFFIILWNYSSHLTSSVSLSLAVQPHLPSSVTQDPCLAG